MRGKGNGIGRQSVTGTANEQQESSFSRAAGKLESAEKIGGTVIASNSHLMTASEFARRPKPADGSKEELVRGEIAMTPPPGFEHGYVQTNIATLLSAHVRKHGLGRVVVETGLVTENDPDSVRGPDVSFWSKERLPMDQKPRGYPDVAADLCVEVLSPDDRMPKVMKKVDEYISRGVRLVWIVNPRTQSVAVHRSLSDFNTIEADGLLDGGEVVPGFQCAIKDLF